VRAPNLTEVSGAASSIDLGNPRIKLIARKKLGNPTPHLPIHVAYAYSGLVDRPDGVLCMLRKRGCIARGYDEKSGKNLLDDTVWQQFMFAIKSHLDTVLLSPPCKSFSPSRGKGVGPRILRTIAEPYGIKHPSPPWTTVEEKTLAEGTYHVLKTLEAGNLCLDHGVAFFIERPATIFPEQSPWRTSSNISCCWQSQGCLS
jgi:hypothetical protein